MSSVYSGVVLDLGNVERALRGRPRYYVVMVDDEDVPIFRFTEEGLEVPGVVPSPLWAGLAFIHEGHPVRLTYFEWGGSLWGGVCALDVAQSVIKDSAGRRVEEFLVSCCERVSSLES